MLKQLLFIKTMLLCAVLSAQNITEIDISSSTIDRVFYGEALWLDTTNDSTFEFLITGVGASNSEYTILAQYNQSSFAVDEDNALLALSNSSVDKADFNNDGFMDFIITGNSGSISKTALYINDGNGLYTETPTIISGASTGKIRAADLNNDDLVDVIVTGLIDGAYGAKLYYQNSSGGFDLAAVTLMANYFGDITFIDVNNDNYLDVLLTGFDTNYVPNSKLYINTDGVLAEATLQSIDPYYFTGTGVLDVDNDGDKDIVISGFNSSYVGETAVYLNNGLGVFTKDTISLTTFDQVYFGDLEIVDFNNDGFDDVFSTGQDPNGNYVSNLYINNEAGGFVRDVAISNVIAGVGISSCDWADFDNDGDKDLLLIGFGNDGNEKTKVYRNETAVLAVNSVIKDAIMVYPNPTNVIININGLKTETEVVVQNALGQVVMVEQVRDVLNVSRLETGVYFLLIKIDSVREKVIKFVKE